MYLKRTALPIAGICLSLLVGCEPTHIKNGFASESEMTQLNAMGYEKFEHFQNRGNFSSPERAREALEKGFKTNQELNAEEARKVAELEAAKQLAEEARKVAELEAAKQLAEENKKYGVGMVVKCQSIWIRHVTKNRATMMGYDEKEFGFSLEKRSNTMLWEPNAWYYDYNTIYNHRAKRAEFTRIKRWESDDGLLLRSVQLMKTGGSAGLLRIEDSDDRLCSKRSESDYQKMKADRLAVVNQAAAEKKSVAAQAESDAAESLKSSEF
jgi:hypothetical protein